MVPVYNEAAELERFLDELALQEDVGDVRVVVVDSASSDGTDEVVARSRDFEVVLLQEPLKSHLQARIRGFEHVTADVLVSADVDTRFHRRWLAVATERLTTGVDALTCFGTFPRAFWEAAPTLAGRYYAEVGTVFFPHGHEFDEGRAVLTPQVFADLVRVPSDCCWAFRRDAYELAGGFRHEHAPDGTEVMFEGRNLRFRLDAVGASVGYDDRAPFETSPRRLLHEAERFLGGTAYDGGLSHLRAPTDERHVSALERLAVDYDFARLRRYVVKHYVLLPAISRPSLVAGNEHYFNGAAEAVREAGEALPPGRGAADVHRAADELLPRVLG